MAKEKLAIKGVVYNGDEAALIYKDLERIDNALDNTIALRKGYHDNTKDKGWGAEHIKVHLKENSEGFLRENEVLELGQKARGYLKEFGKPFVDKKGARIYEWFNEDGTKFRLVVDDFKEKKADLKGWDTSPSRPPLSRENIITYFSNRYSDKDINFYNKEVEKAYEDYLDDRASTFAIKCYEIEKKINTPTPKYSDLDIYDIQYKLPLRYLYDKAKNNSIAREILENFETGFEGRGYSGYSMSNNAVTAYGHGQKPLSKFTKEDAEQLSDLLGEKWSVNEVKDFVKKYGEAGYHHTSKHYNKTNFYSIARAIRYIAENEEDYLKKLIEKIPPPEQSQKEINDFLTYAKTKT